MHTCIYMHACTPPPPLLLHFVNQPTKASKQASKQTHRANRLVSQIPMYNVSEGRLVRHPLDALVDGPPLQQLQLLLLRVRQALAHQLHQVPQLQRGVPGVAVQHLGQQQRLLPHRHAAPDELRPRRLQLLLYLLRRVQPHLQTRQPTHHYMHAAFISIEVEKINQTQLIYTGGSENAPVDSAKCATGSGCWSAYGCLAADLFAGVNSARTHCRFHSRQFVLFARSHGLCLFVFSFRFCLQMHVPTMDDGTGIQESSSE
jgi:hypothetical protein